jgi:hypothetical protein
MTVDIVRRSMVGSTEACAGLTVTTPLSRITVLTNRPWTTSSIDGGEPAAAWCAPPDLDWARTMDPAMRRVVANTPAMNHRQVRPVEAEVAMCPMVPMEAWPDHVRM